MGIKDIMTNKISVKCSTKEEYIAFLKAAEKEGMKWASGECPTKHFEYWENKPIFMRKDRKLSGLVLSPSNITITGYTIVNFSDLDLSDCYKEKYQLEIKQKNRSVIATLYDDKGAFIKYAKAKCSPEDEFDFETGKRIALQRLFEIEPKKEVETYHKMVLRLSNCSFGVAGEPTEVEAYGRIKLFVGDVVELFCDGLSKGLCCVCKTSKKTKGFVIGVGTVSFSNGQGSSADGDWLIIKRKSYTEMAAGNVIDGVEYVLNQERKHNEYKIQGHREK